MHEIPRTAAETFRCLTLFRWMYSQSMADVTREEVVGIARKLEGANLRGQDLSRGDVAGGLTR